jgi:hypothetical protein
MLMLDSLAKMVAHGAKILSARSFDEEKEWLFARNRLSDYASRYHAARRRCAAHCRTNVS